MKILVFNAGSSTLKCHLLDLAAGAEGDEFDEFAAPLWQAHLDWHADGDGGLSIETGGRRFDRPLSHGARDAVLARLITGLWEGETAALERPEEIDAVGHRIVHGGQELAHPTLIDANVRGTIERLVPLAPDHLPPALDCVDAARRCLPDVPQVAVFDTGFHRTLGDAAALYAIPYTWFERGVRRYGFHGISHEHAARRAARLMGRPLAELRMITCHLGNGASLCAISGGRSVDTTMGFTPLEGLVMGSRCGSIDPGILLHLQRNEGLGVEDLAELLHRESGLLGISGLSSDMREILRRAESGHPRAQLAFDAYIQQFRRQLGAMLGSLGGLDALVFTGGVGENAARVRQEGCAPFGFIGITLDQDKNRMGLMATDLRHPSGRVSIFVLPADEERAIARDCRQTMEYKEVLSCVR